MSVLLLPANRGDKPNVLKIALEKMKAIEIVALSGAR
jgi:hypothetical protein